MQNEPEIQDVDTAFRSALKSYSKKLVGMAAGCIVWAILIFYILPPAAEHTLYIALAPVGVIVWYLTRIRNEIISKFYQQFAAVNNYTFTKEDKSFMAEGALFSVGNSRKYYNIIKGHFQNHPIEIFNYQYTYGYGKNRHTYYYTVFEIDYDRVLPRMFLRSDGNRWSMVKPDFNNGRRLKLNSEFDSHFDLFCEEKFEIEALQVFTPNIMHKLMTDWNKLTLEFVNDKIYIYAKNRITKKTDLLHMYELGRYLIEKLSPVLTRMESSVKAMQERM